MTRPLLPRRETPEEINARIETERKADANGADGDHTTKKEGPKKKPQAQELIEIGTNEDRAELFHAADGTAYSDVYVGGHRETHALKSPGYRAWIKREYWNRRKGSPNSDAMSQAMGVLEAIALYDGPVREVHLRIAHVGDAIYLDLCNRNWQAVEITEGGWQVVDEPTVRFQRKKKMLEIPEPVPGADIKTLGGLCDHLNLDPDEDGFKLLASWLLGTLRGKGPFPVLGLSGEMGSAKTDTLYLLKQVVDPTKGGLRGPPKDDRDLFVAAMNGYMLAFDNISHISSDLADSICRLATGAGFSTRALYTDDEEVVFDGQRPIAITAITDVATRSDLADRSLLVHLKAIPEDKRKLQEDVYAAFNDARPQILGALLDVVAHGLMQYPSLRPNTLPRMADFAKWMLACETAMWEVGMFMAAYEVSQKQASTNVLDADLVAATLLPWIKRTKTFEGTPTELWTNLEAQLDDQQRRRKDWPKSAAVLTNRLTRLGPSLRKAGVTIDNDDRTKRQRIVKLNYERPEDAPPQE